MSLSDNGKSKNPATKFIEYKSSKSFFYYDREKKENIPMPKKFFVIPLDRLATITGWHDASQSGIYSNEVHRTNEEELNVRSFKGGEIVKGLYSDIKGNLQGGKYAASLYCALLTGTKGNTELELVNIKFSGSGLSPLIDLKLKLDGSIVELSQDPNEQKKGATTYLVPKMVLHAPDTNLMEKATALDVELKEYLGSYKATTTSEVETVSEEATTTLPPTISAEVDDDLPF